MDGDVIKEIVYDPFGWIVEDTNPGFRIPLGFAGGLHDRDLGFVRFGWRDYDVKTGRWTAPDPIGDRGGDPDWYGYCLDDPVNAVDPAGLDGEFRFGQRELDMPGGKRLKGFGPAQAAATLGMLHPTTFPFASKMMRGAKALDDKNNVELVHEQGFYVDGTGDNIGLGPDGKMDGEDIERYKLEDKLYDGKRMRRAERSTPLGKYNACGIGGDKNNCQDYADRLRNRYELLNRGDKMR
ncbi:RHS repeat-associated core domain-containing protein [Pseudodesulfovibrio indicus]|uniref:RHS repeat-associated core domain-containing protein n=1 Tax=Pseudodesulfovibrio indicus TaxID=1716143 RepID=UPI00292FF4DA|nr:RHS repeat-associated core domain-containing protein [Pseudodesulfovibrio indicus]